LLLSLHHCDVDIGSALLAVCRVILLILFVDGEAVDECWRAQDLKAKILRRNQYELA
jgi:hypothetical protein